RIRNAFHALHKDVNIPRSKMKEAIAAILKEEGYIEGYSADERTLTLELKYVGGKPAVAGLKKISKPGRRVYVPASDIPRVQNGLGICILSTSKGLLAGQKATEAHVGGEVLCEIW
ncbi:30S ribosomal protein S8, partial [Oceanidesulfovibrio indonesiensis]